MKRDVLFRYIRITIGCLIYALAFDWCYAPTNISYGGFTGVAQIIYHFFRFPTVGVSVFLMNLPLYLLGWKLLGGRMLVSGLYGMTVSSVFIDLLAAWIPFQAPESLLACIYGGLLLGIGLGLIIGAGASTGGTDLLARLLKFPFPWLPMGTLLMAADLVVICSSAVVFRDLNNAMYGLIGLYISTVVMDGILYGLDRSKVAYIISDRPKEFVRAIDEEMDRGSTLLHGTGGYSGRQMEVVMCAFKQKQIVALKQLAKRVDPDAFIIVCDAHDVLGNGFHFYRENEI